MTTCGTSDGGGRVGLRRPGKLLQVLTGLGVALEQAGSRVEVVASPNRAGPEQAGRVVTDALTPVCRAGGFL